MEQQLDISVVLPCLNEEEALPSVIDKINLAFKRGGLTGEIVVCDNGSTDNSIAIAESLGARVVHEPMRGYGRAYQKGFSTARGQILVMGDADDTYDFLLLPELISPIRAGHAEFVTGSRYLGKGSAEIPLLHRLVGNPLLTRLLNSLFGSSYTDVYCGMRAFARGTYDRIRPISTGMEYNLELAINATLARLKILEIPIELGPRKGTSKLKTFRDGWRSLRMMLLYCPNKVFIWPGMIFLFAGILLQTLPFVHFGIVTALFGSMASVIGFKILSLGLHAKSFSWSRRFDAENQLLKSFYTRFKLEHGLLLGATLALAGLAILGVSIARTPRPEWISIGTTLVIIGIETIFTSLFISTMSMESL